jgi:hypothetical protein
LWRAERWLALGGADADARVAQAADELGLSAALLERPLATLSASARAPSSPCHDVRLRDALKLTTEVAL